jgi:DNA-binding protein H-NS
MSTTIITRHDKIDGSHLLELSCGKQSASFWIAPWYVQVRNNNASHRVWGGMGKRFENLEQALSNYKSREMQAMIRAAMAAIQ